jgi:hypothetical protein
MTHKEGNVLIAEFMGAKYDKDTSFPIHPDDLWLPFHGICNWTKKHSKTLQYHLSWDWLMPVVEKIEKIGETDTNYGTLCDITTNHISIGDITLDHKNKDYDTKIEGTWKAVIIFIEKFNEEQQADYYVNMEKNEFRD